MVTFKLRVPTRVWQRLCVAAAQHHLSTNELILRRLDRRATRSQVKQQMLALEPSAEDTRTDEEIASEIEYLEGSLRW
jgi:hypothetical protein